MKGCFCCGTNESKLPLFSFGSTTFGSTTLFRRVLYIPMIISPSLKMGLSLSPIFMRVDRPTDGSPLIIPTQVQGGYSRSHLLGGSSLLVSG